jgi:3-dehydroquinate synthase
MKTLLVELKDRSYNIHIGRGLLDQTGALLEPFSGRRAVVLTDENVWGLYGERLQEALEDFFPHKVLVLKHGEGSKSLSNLEIVLEFMAESGLTRSDLLINFGGGVIGDLGGFAAGCYMRGISTVQIPTTLLSQVDSSVGGKTAVNLKCGKNLAGLFWQPKLVIADTELLHTLPDREFAGGMAEVIKYGAIRSKEMFDKLGTYSGRADAAEALPEIIYECCDIKRDIVRRDEFDTGERMLLNFGHTFGHAVEKIGNYERFIHGEAVAIGMIMAARYGAAAGESEPDLARNCMISAGDSAFRRMNRFHGGNPAPRRT